MVCPLSSPVRILGLLGLRALLGVVVRRPKGEKIPSVPHPRRTDGMYMGRRSICRMENADLSPSISISISLFLAL